MIFKVLLGAALVITLCFLGFALGFVVGLWIKNIRRRHFINTYFKDYYKQKPKQ